MNRSNERNVPKEISIKFKYGFLETTENAKTIERNIAGSII